MTDSPTDLPISMLNQLAYCPRRFWLMYVQGEMVINAPVLEGTLQHERVHTAGRNRQGDKVVHRRVYVYSKQLRLRGFLDVVEEVAGQLIPVEYKRGRMGRWLNDQVQLCAQALCLEERSGRSIPYGYIFYAGSRRRKRVELTPELRARTRETIAQAFALLEAGQIPPPEQPRAKCRDCSLEPICLPREVQALGADRRGRQ